MRKTAKKGHGAGFNRRKMQALKAQEALRERMGQLAVKLKHDATLDLLQGRTSEDVLRDILRDRINPFVEHLPNLDHTTINTIGWEIRAPDGEVIMHLSWQNRLWYNHGLHVADNRRLIAIAEYLDRVLDTLVAIKRECDAVAAAARQAQGG